MSGLQRAANLALALALVQTSAFAQPAPPPPPAKPAQPYTPTSLKPDPGLPRTPDGHPDFQGEVWATNFFGLLSGLPPLTPKELVITAEQSKKVWAAFVAGAKISPMLALDPEVPGLLDASDGFPVVRGQYRSRLVVQPADGQLPLTPAAAEIRAALTAVNFMKADNPEDRMRSERCLDLGATAPLAAPSPLSPRQFVQTKDFVGIQTEYGDELHVIPFADRHQTAALAIAGGDSIARWEGDTLVVETTNAPAAERMRASPFGALIVNPEAKVIERFTRVTRDEIVYQFTIVDPQVYAAPWLAEYSLRRASYRMFPSGCHEGNYGLANILAGQRQVEAAARAWAQAEKVSLTTTEPAAAWTQWFGAGPTGLRAWAVMPAAGGHPRVALRIEHPKAQKVGGADVLSELDLFAVDCAGQKLQLQAQTSFEARNFTGARHDQTPPDAWAPAATRPAIAEGVTQVCAAPLTQVSQR